MRLHSFLPYGNVNSKDQNLNHISRYTISSNFPTISLIEFELYLFCLDLLAAYNSLLVLLILPHEDLYFVIVLFFHHHKQKIQWWSTWTSVNLDNFSYSTLSFIENREAISFLVLFFGFSTSCVYKWNVLKPIISSYRSATSACESSRGLSVHCCPLTH